MYLIYPHAHPRKFLRMLPQYSAVSPVRKKERMFLRFTATIFVVVSVKSSVTKGYIQDMIKAKHATVPTTI